MKVIFYLYSRSALHSMVSDVMLCLSVTSHTGTVLRQLNLRWWHATEGGGTVLVETLNPAQSVNRYWGWGYCVGGDVKPCSISQSLLSVWRCCRNWMRITSFTAVKQCSLIGCRGITELFLERRHPTA